MHTLRTHVFRVFAADSHAQSAIINENFCIGAQEELYQERVVGWVPLLPTHLPPSKKGAHTEAADIHLSFKVVLGGVMRRFRFIHLAILFLTMMLAACANSHFFGGGGWWVGKGGEGGGGGLNAADF